MRSTGSNIIKSITKKIKQLNQPSGTAGQKRENSMTKPELVAAVAAQVGITKADAERAINFTFQSIADAIRKDGRFDFHGFGVFKVFRSAAVSRPNPQDRSKIINTPARNTVKFKPSPTLKSLVNK
jgi:DNA-binding protein HU-beta